MRNISSITRFLLLIVIIFVYNDVKSQEESIGDWDWLLSLGDNSADGGYAIKQKGDRVYVSGNYTDTLRIGGEILVSRALTLDMFVAAFDLSGNLIWVRTSQGLSRQNAISVDADDLGNVYVGGYYEDTLRFGDTYIVSVGAYDAFLCKYNQNGEFQWANSCGSTANDILSTMGTQIALDDSSNVYWIVDIKDNAIFTDSLGIVDTIRLDTVRTDVTGALIVKYNSNGKMNWWRVLFGKQGYGTSAQGICIDNSGNPYMTGLCRRTVFISQDNYQLSYDTMVTESSYYNAYIVKYDRGGSILKRNYYGGIGDIRGHRIQTDDDYNVYLAGYFATSAQFTSEIVYSIGNNDLFIVKYDSTLNKNNCLWAQYLQGTGNDNINDMRVKDGDIYLTGFFTDSLSLDINDSLIINRLFGSAVDIFVLKYYTDNGSFNWGFQSGGVSTDEGWGIDVDACNNMYLTGRYSVTATFEDTTLASSGSTDIFIGKYGVNSFSIGGVQEICKHSITELMSDSVLLREGEEILISSYNWNTGDTLRQIEVSPLEETTYALTVTAEDGCTASKDVVVSIKNPAIINIGNDTSICNGSSSLLSIGIENTDTSIISYEWNTLDTLSTITVQPSITSTYMLTVTYSNTCIDADTAIVTIVKPELLNPYGDTTICYGDSIMLEASTGVSFNWSTGDTTQLVKKIFVDTTEISVIILTQEGCQDTSTAIISVLPEIQVDFTSDSVGQIYDTLFFTNTTVDIDSFSYVWYFDRDIVDSVNASHAYDNYGNKAATLKASSSYGCFAYKRKDILILQKDSVNYGWILKLDGKGDDSLTKIAVDPFGNTYFGGIFDSDTLFLDTISYLINRGSNDIVFGRVNTDGELKWLKTIGGVGDEQINSICMDSSLNVYIVGSSNSGTVYFENEDDYLASNVQLGFIAKYDSLGNLLKKAGFVYGNDFEINSLKIDIDDNLYFIGNFSDTLLNVGGVLLSNSLSRNFFLGKLNSDFNIEWVRTTPNEGEEQIVLKDMDIDLFGNIYVVGEFTGSLELGSDSLINEGTSSVITGLEQSINSIIEGNNLLINHDLLGLTKDVFTAKYSSSGSIKSIRVIGGEQDETAGRIYVDALGDQYVAGTYSSDAISIGLQTLQKNSTYYSSFIFKNNFNNNVNWFKEFSGSKVNVTSLRTDHLDNVYIGGYFSGGDALIDNQLLTNPNGESNIFSVMYNKLMTKKLVVGQEGYGDLAISDIGVDGVSNYYLGLNTISNVSGIVIMSIGQDTISTAKKGILIGKGIIPDNSATYCAKMSLLNYIIPYCSELSTSTTISVASKTSDLLDRSSTITQLEWSTGETTTQIEASTDKITTVNATYNDGCTYKYAFKPKFAGFTVDAGADRTVCAGIGTKITAKTDYLNNKYGDCSYLWSTSETTSSIYVKPMVKTTYTVTVTGPTIGSDYCMLSDQVEVDINTDANDCSKIKYAKFQKALDGNYYITRYNKLHFYNLEEYGKPVKLSVYNYKKEVIPGYDSQGIYSYLILNEEQCQSSNYSVYGDNWYDLDCSGLNAGYYILEIANIKKEKKYLRFSVVD